MSALRRATQASHYAHNRETEPMSITPTKATNRSILGLLGAMIASALLLLAVASPANAAFGIEEFDGTTLDSGGDPYTQAGGHPDLQTVGFETNSGPDPLGGFFPVPDGNMKDVNVELPPGLVGDPSVTAAKCTVLQLALNPGESECPPESRVGELSIKIEFFGGVESTKTGIFNMVPNPGVAAQFGSNVNFLLGLEAEVRPDDYGITIATRNTVQGQIPLVAVNTEFWGIPADYGSGTERKPLLTMPTSCTGPMEFGLSADSWQDIGNFATDSFLSHDLADTPIGLDGCENVPFTPSVDVQPTQSKADSPSGLEVEISVPDAGIKNPDGISQAHLKDVEMTLPEGMAVNPSAADGLNACSEAEIGFGTDSEVGCSDSSKIGTMEIVTPILGEPVEGWVFQAEQDNNPFGSTLAVYLVAENEARGLTIKLAGEITPDEDTGQLVATFEDQPQLPIDTLNVRFKGGDRAPLATPSTCGEYDITTTLTPWSGGDPVEKTSSFTIDKGPDGGACLAGDAGQPGDPADLGSRPFDPELSGGLLSSTAGAFSPFVFKLTRPDGHQEILSTAVSPPEGVTAKLAGLPLCSDADAANGSCGAASQIGTTVVGAGAGPSPFYIQTPNEGKVYMAGPYDPDGPGGADEAPLSMLIQVPAIAGPFDLGTVDVRAAVYVDPTTARLNVVSDDLPQILEGIPLRVRDIRVKVDRTGFTVAPTDCSAKQVQAVARGSHGGVAGLANSFQASDCGGLDFSPEFNFQANNKDATNRSDHPALDTTIGFNQPAGAYDSNAVRPKANIAKAQVTLPSSIILDQDSLETICTRNQYANDACPANTQYGTAVAQSPLLDEPLSGPVYLRASDNPLPDLVADLDGIIDIDLAGKIDQTGGKVSRLRTTFEQVPDQAVSAFNLKLNGGNDGLLVNSQNVCSSKDRRTIDVKVFGQNNGTAHQQPRVSIPACVRKADRKADRLERQAKKLKKKAKKLKRKGKKRKAKKKQRKAKKKLRKAKKTRRAAS